MKQMAVLCLEASERDSVYVRLLLARETGRREVDQPAGLPLAVTDAIELWRSELALCLN